ncbi:hypothetical protein ACFPRL_32870 [Pseudoclavibacter helvolus]
MRAWSCASVGMASSCRARECVRGGWGGLEATSTCPTLPRRRARPP